MFGQLEPHTYLQELSRKYGIHIQHYNEETAPLRHSFVLKGVSVKAEEAIAELESIKPKEAVFIYTREV